MLRRLAGEKSDDDKEKRTRRESPALNTHDSCQPGRAGRRGISLQLLLAARSLFACCRDSGKFSLLCKVPANPTCSLSTANWIRILPILARQAVQLPAKFAERDSSLGLSDIGFAFYSVSAGNRKSSREHFRR